MPRAVDSHPAEYSPERLCTIGGNPEGPETMRVPGPIVRKMNFMLVACRLIRH